MKLISLADRPPPAKTLSIAAGWDEMQRKANLEGEKERIDAKFVINIENIVTHCRRHPFNGGYFIVNDVVLRNRRGEENGFREQDVPEPT